MEFASHEKCRVCGKNNLDSILSLGNQYVVNFLDEAEDKSSKIPLNLDLCNVKDGGCGLLQLRETVSGEILYRNFWYKSGVNQTMIDALRDVTKNVEDLIKFSKNDIVVDIGANDGTLLRTYSNKEIKLVGFEPAKNLTKFADKGTFKIISDFFNFDSFNKVFPNQKSKVITSISMFYDLEDPNEFVRDIKKILDFNGIWVIQMNYLTTMLENNAFDNIVHEHLEYYSLSSLKFLLDKHNLEIFDVELNSLNGGSIRTYVKHKESLEFSISKNVKDILEYEKTIGLDGKDPYTAFAKRIDELKNETVEFIRNEVKNGKKIYVYGASTRGNALLQYYGLDSNLITAAADRNPMKWGKKIIGSQIPIISEEQARKENPDYFLVLPWYFLNEFLEREEEYFTKGGKFIVPLPKFQVIDKKN